VLGTTEEQTEFIRSLSREQKLEIIQRAVQREAEIRRGGRARRELWDVYATNPVGFIEQRLGDFIWSKQKEICRALVEHDRVAVKSCHQSGKSYVTGDIVSWWIAAHPPNTAFVITSAPTFSQVEMILWREVNRAHARGNLIGRTNRTAWVVGNEVVAVGRKPDDKTTTPFQGIHALHMLVAFDEACGVPKTLWDAAESLIANEGGKFLAIGNPDDPNTEFGRVCQPGSGWHVITISAFDTPNFTGEPVPDLVQKMMISVRWAEERKKRWGEASPLYKAKVLGEFPEESTDSLISPAAVAAAVARTLPPVGPSELGVDVARYGRNESVIYHRRGPVARLLAAVNKRDLMTVAGLVVQAVMDTVATKVKVDDAGLGGGVTDRLRELARDRESPMYGVEVVGINVGSTTTSKDAARRFDNLKSELCFQLADRFAKGEIDLGDDEDTQLQCCAMKYELRSNGKLHIESKDEVEERLTKMGGATGESGSPDRFDALVLAFSDLRPEGHASLWNAHELEAA